MRDKTKIAARLIKVPEYSDYTGTADGTTYNLVSEYFRTGSTAGLFAKPVKVGPKGTGVRFDKSKVDRNLDNC